MKNAIRGAAAGLLFSLVIGIPALAIYARAAESAPANDARRPENYPAALAVIEAAPDRITARTCSGLEYTFTASETDLEPGDLIAVLMQDNATPDDVTDDIITFCIYAGYGDPAEW